MSNKELETLMAEAIAAAVTLAVMETLKLVAQQVVEERAEPRPLPPPPSMT